MAYRYCVEINGHAYPVEIELDINTSGDGGASVTVGGQGVCAFDSVKDAVRARDGVIRVLYAVRKIEQEATNDPST